MSRKLILKMKKTTSFPMKQLNPFAKYLKRDRGENKDGKEIKDINLYNDDSHNFIRDFNDGIIKTDDDAIIYLYEA